MMLRMYWSVKGYCIMDESCDSGKRASKLEAFMKKMHHKFNVRQPAGEKTVCVQSMSYHRDATEHAIDNEREVACNVKLSAAGATLRSVWERQSKEQQKEDKHGHLQEENRHLANPRTCQEVAQHHGGQVEAPCRQAASTHISCLRRCGNNVSNAAHKDMICVKKLGYWVLQLLPQRCVAGSSTPERLVAPAEKARSRRLCWLCGDRKLAAWQ
mmetsp:Transcript_42603/g.127781  ORF Transcript_42603/g.127781 Transcript_42603/m.127781 type:complete len:213 (-) Transcript_42603:3943-4581(-)